jgi:hypothetical protein
MAKEEFHIKSISKKQSAEILLKYHYLKDISKGFKSGHNYGLFRNEELLGVVIFTGLPVPELAKSMFGLMRNQQNGLFELSRLCIHPEIQESEHNITSWFVSRCVKKLRKEQNVRAILSYADSDFHEGTIYKACNFVYYGLSSAKKDFWIKQSDGTYIKHSRGKLRGLDGEWRSRTQKHRYLLIFDKSLQVNWIAITNKIKSNKEQHDKRRPI